jgi:hypothetical protein
MTDDQQAGPRADLGASILRSTQGGFAAALDIAIEELRPGRRTGRMALENDHLIQAGGLVPDAVDLDRP